MLSVAFNMEGRLYNTFSSLINQPAVKKAALLTAPETARVMRFSCLSGTKKYTFCYLNILWAMAMKMNDEIRFIIYHLLRT